MPGLDTYAAFAAAVATRDAPPPAGLTVGRGDLASRFAVHRNNVAVARIGVFESLFPICRRLIGAEAFAAAVRRHLALRPPTSPIVARWGDDFAAGLAADPDLGDLGWLVDTARLEAAVTAARDAADAPPLRLADLVGTAPEQLAATVFVPHPSLALIVSAHPIVTIRRAHLAEADPGPCEADRAETAVVVRSGDAVTVGEASPAEHRWLAALIAGATLAEAGAAALAVDADFDVGGHLVRLVANDGLVAPPGGLARPPPSFRRPPP